MTRKRGRVCGILGWDILTYFIEMTLYLIGEGATSQPHHNLLNKFDSMKNGDGTKQRKLGLEVP